MTFHYGIKPDRKVVLPAAFSTPHQVRIRRFQTLPPRYIPYLGHGTDNHIKAPKVGETFGDSANPMPFTFETGSLGIFGIFEIRFNRFADYRVQRFVVHRGT